ncbi:hypothetical protein PPYR_05951 [Photinus pyralis]|uniref:BZIP domain-containing protein n=1 Tax=Photinus pyralis TaxID=7054 RepID=A0A1Y1KUS8_PHOPY|nr:uncharacterized protein LOC116166631 [Photinus pyralis]KAB0800211.1 hypothetical protein PPYR_05951 [Photinus pyralis]
MSRLLLKEYMDDNLDCGMMDPLTQLRRELDEIDIPANMQYENPGLMSSEFFDSVLSMEHSNFDSETDNVSFSTIDTDCGLSSDAEELRMTNNSSPESATSSNGYELNDLILVNGTNVEYNINNNDPMLHILNQHENVMDKAPQVQIPSNLFINNPNGKKVIVTKPVTLKNNRKSVNTAKQVFRVQSISGKGRSVLLPFNVAKMKNIKIINGKELQAENIKVTKIVDAVPTKQTFVDCYEASSPDTFDDDSDSLDTKSESDRQYPILVLSDEEKRLLSKEGICLPTHYPLTKQEERELKRIRRKIRNKISAQDSRKRKKEYVDGLEERIKQGAEEKKILMNRVKHLQQQNSKLIAQMHKLQALVFNTSCSKATPTTCLLIVLVSALLVSLPNLRIPQKSELSDQQQLTARRALLSSSQATTEDSINLDEFLLFNKEDSTVILDEDNNTEEYSYINYEKRYEGHNLINGDSGDIDSDVRKTFERLKDFLEEELNDRKAKKASFMERKFIEPDIDDYVPKIGIDEDEYPPAKKKKVDELLQVDRNFNAGQQVSATLSVNASKKE